MTGRDQPCDSQSSYFATSLINRNTLKQQRDDACARWTLPLWAYVSVTGVLIYILLYQVYAAPHP